MEVDWAAQTLPIYDSVTGESYPVYLFIAVLPCSGYTYAEATSDMKLVNWLNCHIHAYEYFGGAARLLIPDNLKTGVRTPAMKQSSTEATRSSPSTMTLL